MDINPEIINLIDSIKSDKTHGASQLARRAAGVLKVTAEHSQTKSASDFLLELREIGEKLAEARPAMAPIYTIVNRLLTTIAREGAGMYLESIRRLAISRADDIVQDSLQAVARIARHGSELITGKDRILTHSYSSTVVAVLKEAFNRYENIELIVTRSGSGSTGEQIARELGLYGLMVTFIDDTAVGFFLPDVNKVMLGADRVCADGRVINGVGSYQLALLSKTAGIPLYILCDTLKFDPRVASDKVDLEDGEPHEVVELESLPPGVTVKNPHFDITPLDMVTGLITEMGFMTPAEVIDYINELRTL